MEGNGTAVVGEPINLPLGERRGQMMIVSQTKSDKKNSSLEFSFKINGHTAPWWDTNGDVYFWFACACAIFILLSIITGCCGGFYFCLRRSCQKDKKDE